MAIKLKALGATLMRALLLANLIIASLAVGWELLAAQGFGYRPAYRLLQIDRTIDQYGPLNQRRPGFQLTSFDERQRLFDAIVRAIHHRGEGLDQLVYRAGDGRVIGRLLTPAEVIHLQDVARLVSILRPVGWGAIALLLVGSIQLRRKSVSLPGKKLVIAGALLGCGGLGLIAVVGAETIFYQLHRWVFPPGHQWFFYYEESLMSMMMQAPNLFGVVAMFWALLAGLVMVAWYLVVGRKLRREEI